MANYERILTYASWEDRFPLSLTRILSGSTQSKTVDIFYSEELSERTAVNRASTRIICESHNISLREIPIAFNEPAKTWEVLRLHIASHVRMRSTVLVDFSTMPRDILWIVFQLLLELGAVIHYIYHAPFKYVGGSWVSRDPGRPRLVYKLSGLSRFGLRTALVVVTGFDVERTQMLVNRFEPSKLILGLQIGPQYSNQELNVKCHRERFGNYDGVLMVDVDAYAPDHGYSVLMSHVEQIAPQYNFIASSLGPKPSAVAVFKLCQNFPSIGLAYTPSREYNNEYSSGIGAVFQGIISSGIPLFHFAEAEGKGFW